MFDLLSFFENILDTLFLIKLFILVSVIIYMIFLLVVVKQVNSMNEVISEVPSQALRNFAIFMIILSVILFLTALVIL